MTQTTAGGQHLALVNETFTGDVSTAATVPVAATERMFVRAFSLTVTGNTAACPVQLKSSGGAIYFASRVPLIAVGETGETITNPPGWSGCFLPAGEELVIGGGGTNGVLDGAVEYVIFS